MTQAACRPDVQATRVMRAIGHVPRGRIAAACANARAPRSGMWTSTGLGVSAFVSRLLQRHQRARMGGPWPEQALAVRAIGAMTSTERHLHLAYAPRLFLQLAASDRAVVSAMPRPSSAPWHERVIQTKGPSFTSRLLERVLARSERIDTLKVIERAAPVDVQPVSDRRSAALSATLTATASAAQGHVQRVLRTDKPTSIAKPRTKIDSPQRQASEPQPDATPQVSAMPVRGLAPINIEHLADRVVHALDRRLTAQRERHGRLGP